MNKGYAILIMCFVLLLPQTSMARISLSTDTVLYSKAEASLARGDTVESVALFHKLRVELDSILEQNYRNEVKAIHIKYQIDELYLENKLQEGVIINRFLFFMVIIVVLLILVFGYLYLRNRELEKARVIAQKIKEEAEESIQSKTELLYAISKDMTEILTEMKEITANLQTTDMTSCQGVHNHLSNLRSSAEKLQDTYTRIFP